MISECVLLILGFSTVSCISELIPESGARRDGAKMTKTTLIFSVGNGRWLHECFYIYLFFFSLGISSTAIFKQQGAWLTWK